MSLHPVGCLPSVSLNFKPEDTELKERFAESGDMYTYECTPTNVLDDEHKDMILGTVVGEEIWDLLSGFETLKLVLQPTCNDVASSVQDPVSEKKLFHRSHDSVLNEPSSISPGQDLDAGSYASTVGGSDGTIQSKSEKLDLEYFLSRKELTGKVTAALLNWSLTSERTLQLAMIEVFGMKASGKTVLLNSVVNCLVAELVSFPLVFL
jgi:hypothetical protein